MRSLSEVHIRSLTFFFDSWKQRQLEGYFSMVAKAKVRIAVEIHNSFGFWSIDAPNEFKFREPLVTKDLIQRKLPLELVPPFFVNIIKRKTVI